MSTVTLNRVFIHWVGLADPTSMFREAKEVDSQTSQLRPTAKAVDMPPDPNVGAPALDPTGNVGWGKGYTGT